MAWLLCFCQTDSSSPLALHAAPCIHAAHRQAVRYSPSTSLAVRRCDKIVSNTSQLLPKLQDPMLPAHCFVLRTRNRILVAYPIRLHVVVYLVAMVY